MKKFFLLLTLFFLGYSFSFAQKVYKLQSPDGKLGLSVGVGKSINYSLTYKGNTIVTPSVLSMQIDGAKSFGTHSKLKSVKTSSHTGLITSIIYKKDKVSDNYNELLLQFKEHFDIIFRAYNEGIAYRFISHLNADFKVMGEEATFNFPKDWQTYIPYVKEKKLPIEQQFNNSFENTYTHCTLSQIDTDRLAFSPIVVEADGGVKLCIAESDLESGGLA